MPRDHHLALVTGIGRSILVEVWVYLLIITSMKLLLLRYRISYNSPSAVIVQEPPIPSYDVLAALY